MINLLRTLPEAFGKSFVAAGMFPVITFIFLNLVAMYLVTFPFDTVHGQYYIKFSFDIFLQPTILVVLMIASIIIYNLRNLSIRIMSGNIPFFFDVGKKYQVFRYNRIRKKIFGYLSPYGWAENGMAFCKHRQFYYFRDWWYIIVVYITTTLLILKKKYNLRFVKSVDSMHYPLYALYRLSFINLKRKSHLLIVNMFWALIRESCNNNIKLRYGNLFLQKQKEREALYSSRYYDYPKDVVYIMPSLFGTILRKVESHVKYCYGISHKLIWPHMLHVASSDYMQLVSAAKIRLEASSQITFASMLTTLFWLFIHFTHGFNYWKTVIAFIVLTYLFYFVSLVSAREYVRQVIGCYDLFQKDLLEALPQQHEIGQMRERWGFLSDFLQENRKKSF